MYTVNSKGEKVKIKRQNVGEVDFDCPNCRRALHRTLWEDITEEDAEFPMSGPITALANCVCGAQLLVGDDGENVGLYWLNEHERCFYPKFRKFCFGRDLYQECQKNLAHPNFEDRPCKNLEKGKTKPESTGISQEAESQKPLTAFV